MNVTVSYREFVPSRPPAAEDVTQHLSGEVTLVIKGGVPIVVVAHYAGDTTALHAAAATIKYPEHAKRTNGLPVKNRSFGFTTRNVIRGDYCSAAGLAREDAETHRVLCDFAVELEAMYESRLPSVFAVHAEKARKRIAQDWKLSDQHTFTSGNANRNNAIRYHFDTGNISGVCSAMIVLRSGGATGGELILPEYDIGLYLDDGDVLFFDGQGILHGVTPIELPTPESYRTSLVYYTLDQMWKCLTGDEEIERIKREKTERERAIVGKRGYRGGKPEFRKRRDLPNK